MREDYEGGWSIPSIFPLTQLGPNSHRDGFAIAYSKEEAAIRIHDLLNPTLSLDALRLKYGLRDNRDWSLADARKITPKGGKPKPCIYRPFDFRFMLYGAYAFDYHRPEINNQMSEPNLALLTTKQTVEAFSALATDLPAGQHKLVTPYDGSYLSPLFIYPDKHSLEVDTDRRANLSPEFVRELTVRVGEEPTPEDIFYYIYAILYAPMYRTRYADFLKRDFPRIPLPPDEDTFRFGVDVGGHLVKLHLLEDPALNNTGITFPKVGTNLVEKMRADRRYVVHAGHGNRGYVRLNATQVFEYVPPEAWEFRVGGYQPAFKWLDDRAGRMLTEEDINHYRKMLAAMRETVTLQSAADQVFERVLETMGTV